MKLIRAVLITAILFTLAISLVQAQDICQLTDGRVNARPHRDCSSPVAVYMTNVEVLVLAYEPAISNKPEQFVIRAPRNNNIPSGANEILGQGTNPVNGKPVILSRLVTGEYQLNTFRDTGEAYILVWYKGAEDVYHLDPVTGGPMDGAQPIIVPGGNPSPSNPAPASTESDSGSEAAPSQGSTSTSTVGDSPASAVGLSNCRVTTTRIVRLRTAPDTNSEIITRLPYRTSWQVTGRTAGWFRIVFEDQQAWFSADYASTTGDCGA